VSESVIESRRRGEAKRRVKRMRQGIREREGERKEGNRPREKQIVKVCWKLEGRIYWGFMPTMTVVFQIHGTLSVSESWGLIPAMDGTLLHKSTAPRVRQER
jgi:hypothetical protein